MKYHGQLTPPSTAVTDEHDRLQCPGGSSSSRGSYYPREQDWSPQTAATAATTPPRSPPRIRETGPLLLPKVRIQDQLMEPMVSARSSAYHVRTASLPSNGFPMRFGERLPLIVHPPCSERRSRSPEAPIYEKISPASTTSPLDHMIHDHASLARRPTMGHNRSVSTSSVRTHSRNVSSSSIDASMLSRYGYPTYRQSPTPQPVNNSAPMTRAPSAVNHLSPIAIPNAQVRPYAQSRRTASPSAPPSRLSAEVEFDPKLDLQTTTALTYLTAPNPAPSLTRRTVDAIRGSNTHFWFDVRNVRSWTSFNVDTISAIPDLIKLLQFPVPMRVLPTPHKVNLNPESTVQLADLCASHHAIKVNAALRLTQGNEKHMAMRTLRSAPGTRPQPEFVSNYHSDLEKTIFGDGRGRVVGIVKCYDQWNSGMRNGENPSKVKYLQGLAQLHRFMREHGTRYGFIMTEIELVCVRAGGPPSRTSNVPLFGFLEVAKPVQISTCGTNADGRLRMTVGLSLWWLHMLAREQPFAGQYYWRMDVGGPAALTRQHHLARDDWMPKAINLDTREAKRMRGWIWPEEPLSKRECGRGRKIKA